MRTPVSLSAFIVLALNTAAISAAAQGFDHSTCDSVLAEFVNDSRVDYAALQIRQQALGRYVEQLGEVSADEFEGWSEAEQIAYLINAYNAFMMKMVIDNYPIKARSFFSMDRHVYPNNSVRQIKGVFDGIRHRAAGEELTLDDIEHGRLRTDYNEPRIHFALVCAAMSCPPLREEAYRGDILDEQLDDQGRAFLNDPRENRLERERGRVHLSKIFDWFGDDFVQFAPESGYQGDDKVRGVLAFVSRYLLDRDVEFLMNGDYRVEFESYDWTLNDQAIAAASQ